MIRRIMAFLMGGCFLLVLCLTFPVFAKNSPDVSGQKIYLPLVLNPSAAERATLPTWLEHVNQYRRMAGLPDLQENPALSYNDWLHARYIVKSDELGHSEKSTSAWYSEGGNAAAGSSDLAADFQDHPDTWAIDSWMQAPFHAIGILDPKLGDVGFGSYREADGGLVMAAGMDIISGLRVAPAGLQYPIYWPGDGATVPLRLYWGEWPSPLTGCPGYSAPAGLPLLLQVGPGGLTPRVTAHSFSQGDRVLESCVFDETSYTNPDASAQQTGRAILATRDAIVLIPRSPLTPGAAYRVSITENGREYSWSFSVAADAP
jgi:uncharacterized protein YkwD